MAQSDEGDVVVFTAGGDFRDHRTDARQEIWQRQSPPTELIPAHSIGHFA